MTLDDPTLTPRMQSTLRAAARIARQYGHTYIGTEHVLLAFLMDEGGIASSMLRQMGDVEVMQPALETILSTPPEADDAP